MGPAHSSVVNQTMKPLCVVTFNMADLIYKTYHTLYIIEPGETCKVEANPDAIGLKLGIIYESRKEKQELFFHRFTCNNDSILTITEMENGDIQYYGDGTTLNAKGKLRETSVEPFNMAADTLQSEMAVAPAPSKAKTEMKALMKKVADTSENIMNKAAAVIEHPVEFVKSGGHIDMSNHSSSSAVVPPIPSVTASNDSNSSDYDNAFIPTNFNIDGNSTAGNNSNLNGVSKGGGLFGVTPQKSMSATASSQQQQQQQQQQSNRNGFSSNTNTNSVQQRSNANDRNQTSNNNKGNLNRQQQQQTGRQSPIAEEIQPVQSESSKASAAEKWEAELQRVKLEKKWEAEVARIKLERRLETEEAERKAAEEEENIRQGKLQPTRRRKGGADGVEVVGAGGCACIIA